MDEGKCRSVFVTVRSVALQSPIFLGQDIFVYKIYYCFPQCVGAIDGSRIPKKGPMKTQVININRKRYTSLNVQLCAATDTGLLTWYANGLRAFVMLES